MRVPGISATAGYAAQKQFQPYLSEQFYSGLPPTAELNKNNGNDALSTQQLRLESTSNFVSSADEFVQRALSSVPISYEAENNFEFLRVCNENKNINSDIKQSPGEQNYTHDDAIEYNTYRSFKDAFNINKTFYEECAKNLNALNTHEVEEDIDPILVINSPSYPDDVCSNEATNTVEDQSLNKYNRSNIGDIYKYQDDKTSSIDHINDNDYDDQMMLDLCQDQSNETINEVINREVYLSSPTSTSSTSDQTPKHTFSYFPRGIINPNYPGFQHLAHTLSEHFITTKTSRPDSYASDSDVSEYEMELSADSFEDLSDEANEQQFNCKLNKYNNNNLEKQQTAKIIREMHPDDEILESESLHTEQGDVYECFMACADNSDNNCNIDIGDLPISLKTTLTLLEPADRLPTPCETPEPTEENENLYENCKDKYATTTASPPDILIKDEDHLHATEQFNNKNVHRPDLLHGVSPHHKLYNSKSKVQLALPKTILIGDQPTVNGCIELPSKDEMSLGVTPVDIIGDFGQEVEREFGLLVSGYRRLMDGPVAVVENEAKTDDQNQQRSADHLIDAELSNVKDEIDMGKYLAALNNCKQHQQTTTTRPISACDFMEDNNAVDWSLSKNVEENIADDAQPTENPEMDEILNETTATTNDETLMDDESKSNEDHHITKPKYQKASYDERQLPPVAIEYKRCHQNQKKARGPTHLSSEKNTKSVKKPSFTNRFLHGKRSVFKSTDQGGGSSNRKNREDAEMHQYQQLINDKELILSNSRYTKLSSWAQYLKNSVKDRKAPKSIELISPSALELFEAYKVGGEVDRETLQKHLKMAKEIEKKRRSDREEIRRRLAMGGDEENITDRQVAKSSIQNGLNICRLNDISSDTESHSSDSETCPKLSKIRQDNVGSFSSLTNDHISTHPYHGRPLSVSCTNKHNQQKQKQQHQKEKVNHNLWHQEKELLPITDEDKECDFFTKQARLQIEARMALAQAKEMAHLHMEFERQNRRMSPITGIIRSSLDKIGVRMSMDKRRVSRQMLTDMNIAQLQILVNSLHTHIEDLNESLVQFLMERDDLHVGQDAMLADIEELTRFIGAQEHLIHQHKKSNKCFRFK